jgi:hypothetical protein
LPQGVGSRRATAVVMMRSRPSAKARPAEGAPISRWRLRSRGRPGWGSRSLYGDVSCRTALLTARRRASDTDDFVTEAEPALTRPQPRQRPLLRPRPPLHARRHRLEARRTLPHPRRRPNRRHAALPLPRRVTLPTAPLSRPPGSRLHRQHTPRDRHLGPSRPRGCRPVQSRARSLNRPQDPRTRPHRRSPALSSADPPAADATRLDVGWACPGTITLADVDSNEPASTSSGNCRAIW